MYYIVYQSMRLWFGSLKFELNLNPQTLSHIKWRLFKEVMAISLNEINRFYKQK